MDDYLAMLRRRLKVILIPALVAPLTGFLVSYALPARYTSTATVLVEGQKVPDTYVTPVITQDFAQRVQSLSQEILTPAVLRPVIHDLALVPPDQEGKLIGQIQQGMQVDPVITSMSVAVNSEPASKKKPSAGNEPVPGVNISYTDSNGVRAQKICNALASLMVTQNLKSRSTVAQDTTDFLGRQVADAKKTLDDKDTALAAFKKQHMGELPTDVDNNMRMLTLLNTQLDAATQTLARSQQDRTYAQSMLAQQIATWKSSLSSTNPQTLQQELTQLQGQLLQLQARYTDDYPDVIKTKADIAEVEKKLKEVNAAAAAAASGEPSSDSTSVSANSSEPPEIRQLRLQIHQYQQNIDQATQDQKRYQSSINVLQARTALSPSIEEEYNALTRDETAAQNFYNQMLAKETSAGLGTSMEIAQEGEQMRVGSTASLSDTPSFPVRPTLAAAGLGVGFAFGVLIAVILEFSDKSIRTEKDAAASTDLPLLIAVPWVGGDDEDDSSLNGNGRRRFWGRGDTGGKEEHEHVGV
jgi:uncharacterized protein involved in exopolysaccharide biosynthesis